MEKETLLGKLPNNFVEDLKLSEDLLNLIVNQYKLLQEYNQSDYISHYSMTLTTDGKLFLPEGTLIHGVRKKVDKQYLESVRKNGLLAAEFLGEYEDCETFYCADFFRVEKDYTMEEYYNWYTTLDSTGILKQTKAEFKYLPVYNEFKDTESIAFVVNNNPLFYQFLQYDYYRENENFSLMQKFVNLGIVEEYKERRQDRLACVLVGVPQIAITGTLITEKLAKDTKFIETLKKEFPNSYIALAKDGTMVYIPPYIVIETCNKVTL